MIRRFWLLCALVLLAAGGCNSIPTTGSGGKLVGPKEMLTKIVSLSPSTTEIAGSVNLIDRLVGRTASCDSPIEARSAVVVVQGTKPDFEKLAKIQPDLIIYEEGLYANTDMEKLKSLGAKKILVLDGSSIDKLMDFELELGHLTQAETVASEQADKIYSARERARGAAPAKRVRVAVLLPGTGDYMAPGSESYLAEVVTACGGELTGPPGKLFAPLSIERLLQFDPEIILVPKPKVGPEVVGKVLQDARLSSVSAVKSSPRRVYEVPEDYLYRAGPKTEALLDSLSNKIAAYASGASQ